MFCRTSVCKVEEEGRGDGKGGKNGSGSGVTSEGDQIVDHLSKGEGGKVVELAPGAVEVRIWSECFLNWIKHPVVLWDLGRQLMLESEVWKKRAGRDFKGDMRNVSQLLKWKKEGGKVGQRRKKEESE